MARKSKPFLHTRSDGFTETPDGDIAVVMKAFTGCNDKACWFQYKMSYGGPSMRVEWKRDDVLLLLPMDVVTGLISRGYSRLPDEEEIQLFAESASGKELAAQYEPDTKGAPDADKTPTATQPPLTAKTPPLAAPVPPVTDTTGTPPPPKKK